jgi:hypothetical protein
VSTAIRRTCSVAALAAVATIAAIGCGGGERAAPAPALASLEPELAAELARRTRRHTCEVGLVAHEVLSLRCRRDSPDGLAHVGFTYWRELDLPTIDPAELVGAARLNDLCGDAPRPSFVVDRDGLRWVPDTNHGAPTGCPDGIAWGDMAPTTPRARATVSRTGRTPPP